MAPVKQLLLEAALRSHLPPRSQLVLWAPAGTLARWQAGRQVGR